jgi:peptidase M28-like protein
LKKTVPALLVLMLLSLPLPALAGNAYQMQIEAFEQNPRQCPNSVAVHFAHETIVLSEGLCSITSAALISQAFDLEQIYLLRDHRPVEYRTGYKTLFRSDGVLLVEVTDPSILANRNIWSRKPIHGEKFATAPVLSSDPRDPIVSALLAEMNEDTYGDYLSGLSEDFATRLTCTSEAIDASDWIAARFEELDLTVTAPEFSNPCPFCEQVAGFNVVAEKIGVTRPEEVYLVGAHYDSISMQGCTSAPGANDNASGAAGVLELARAFAKWDTEATVLFVAFGGEETGLNGSTGFVQELVSEGTAKNLRGFVALDMIAFYQDTYGGLLEGSGGTQDQTDTLEFLGWIGRTYTELEISTTTDYWGSDHVPFLDQGIPGALLIETDFDLYPYYHTTSDTFDQQDLSYGVEMTRLAGAALATWAGLLEKPEPVDDDDDDDDDNDDNDTSGDDDDTIADDDGNEDRDEDESNGCGC